MWGRGQRNKVMKYGEGPQRVRCPWAPNVLATPLLIRLFLPQRLMVKMNCSTWLVGSGRGLVFLHLLSLRGGNWMLLAHRP